MGIGPLTRTNSEKEQKKTVPHVDKIAFISFVLFVFSDTLLFWRKLAPTYTRYIWPLGGGAKLL